MSGRLLAHVPLAAAARCPLLAAWLAASIVCTPAAAQGLAGDWVLTHWEADGREPASLAPTLSVQGERVSGWAGCNRYMGSLLGEGTKAQTGGGAGASPERWRLGPLATTRRACDEGAMEVERRFLERLARSTHFSVEGDRLRLLQRDESDTERVLRLDRR